MGPLLSVFVPKPLIPVRDLYSSVRLFDLDKLTWLTLKRFAGLPTSAFGGDFDFPSLRSALSGQGSTYATTATTTYAARMIRHFYPPRAIKFSNITATYHQTCFRGGESNFISYLNSNRN
ncbi:hypothetical protein EGR_06590 [Echinococcus granulosus]|uniref:Uncharacterized protein n=1 Tax=Echinococcus granulosus TaxID=6210 RepID=W6UB41_ECHGR|nr:hypothetical protein EGR_06590 [Echinococcus granulosus]EUB58603.1 hypothetical protein EGR_06590 [Echinococcus granulosus]